MLTLVLNSSTVYKPCLSALKDERKVSSLLLRLDSREANNQVKNETLQIINSLSCFFTVDSKRVSGLHGIGSPMNNVHQICIAKLVSLPFS